MKQTEQKRAVCWRCKYMETSMRNCGRNSFYCTHQEAHTETRAQRRIAQSRAEVIPIKTAPRWCPLNAKKEEA